MNKKLLTVALAAAMVAPVVASAETTLYGRVDNVLVNTDDDTVAGDVWDVAGNSSRFGLKGSEDLGNGLKAIFQYEWALESSEGTSTAGAGASVNNRLAYVGVAGGFGTLAVGRQWTPYYGSVDKTDLFNNASVGAASANGYYLGLTRTGDAIAYISPNFNGFQAKLAAVIDDGRTQPAIADVSDGIDAYNLSLDYDNGPLSVGFSWLDYDSALETAPGSADRWGIAGKYNFGNFAIAAQYENRDDSTAGNDGADSYGLGAEAYFGNNTVRAVYGSQDRDAETFDRDSWGLGFQHNFSKRTRVYVEYYSTDTSATATATELAIGLRHDF